MELRRLLIVNAMEREESWYGTSQHWGSIPMWWAVCQCSWLWNCRRYSPRGDCGRWCLCSQCNEGYTMVQLPASTSSKGTASLHVKVDTRAGGNVLPLCVFQHLYPNWISPAGLPTGLDHVSTRLTAYNGSHIPLYGSFCGPIIWWPGGPGTWPHMVISYWYVAETPGPAILHLPSCERLAVVKLNCAITVIQPNTKPPSPAPTPTATVVKPAAAPAAAKPIKPTDGLIKEFPDQFTGIGRFTGEYTIWLHHDVHPILHASRKCPISLCPKVKEHLNKMECMGVITCMDQPMDWVSSITYVQKANSKQSLCLDPHDLNEAICCYHHKTPTVEEVAHEFIHSHYFTKLDAHHRYWSLFLIRNPACSQPSTAPLEDTTSYVFPLALSVLKISSRRRWTRS